MLQINREYMVAYLDIIATSTNLKYNEYESNWTNMIVIIQRLMRFTCKQSNLLWIK